MRLSLMFGNFGHVAGFEAVYAEIKKVVNVDSKMMLETTPMGRGMLKMSAWFQKVFKKRGVEK
jgi:hypothetical protein